MTPKEKAKEIYLKYRTLNLSTWINSEDAKKMSLIAVDLRLDGDFLFSSIEYGEDSLEYWEEVKQEIEKL